MTSTCVKKGDTIIKKYIVDEDIRHIRGIQHHWERECFALDILKGKPHTPELLKIEPNKITMSYCGKHITKKTLPKNWKKQCKEINQMQMGLQLYHTDIKLENICVKDGTIFLIDWGMIARHQRDWHPIENTIQTLWD